MWCMISFVEIYLFYESLTSIKKISKPSNLSLFFLGPVCLFPACALKPAFSHDRHQSLEKAVWPSKAVFQSENTSAHQWPLVNWGRLMSAFLGPRTSAFNVFSAREKLSAFLVLISVSKSSKIWLFCGSAARASLRPAFLPDSSGDSRGLWFICTFVWDADLEVFVVSSADVIYVVWSFHSSNCRAAHGPHFECFPVSGYFFLYTFSQEIYEQMY